MKYIVAILLVRLSSIPYDLLNMVTETLFIVRPRMIDSFSASVQTLPYSTNIWQYTFGTTKQVISQKHSF